MHRPTTGVRDLDLAGPQKYGQPTNPLAGAHETSDPRPEFVTNARDRANRARTHSG